MVKLDFSEVILEYGQFVLVNDYSAGYNDTGVWVETPLETNPRKIYGIVLSLAPEDIQLLQQGEQSVAGIALVVNANVKLYFNDNQESTESEYKQSYINHNGMKYRVIGSCLVENNSKQKIYNCLRVQE